MTKSKQNSATGPLAGRVAVVTGSSSGIGRATAITLASAGADVVIHGGNPSESLKETADLITKAGGQCTAFTADFSDSGYYSGFVESAWDWRGGVDIWVNNAGADVLTGTWRNASVESRLLYVNQVDVAATLMLSRAIGSRMREKQLSAEAKPWLPTIVNVGWDQAWQGMAGESGELFATTKGAVMAMTKSLAQSLAPHIRVNCVAPGWIKTAWGEQADEYWDRRARRESLLDRWGQPDDVADAIAFLAGDRSRFISGHILPVNGGFNYSQEDER